MTEQGEAIGCDDYATKPIDRTKLVAIVAKHAAKQQAIEVADAPS